jgi:amino acid adenylation domain-containing protein
MLLPVGIPGELAVSGDGVARGYLNNMELTAEKFLEQVTCAGDRCKSETSSNKKLLRGVQGGGFLEKSPPGRRRQKIYKTGDLVRWLPDGNIEFLGRIDLQVKIRGYRIELGEIESQLLKHEDIEEAVAVLREKNHLGKYIYAYFVAGGEKTVRELRHFLSHVLPDYMIPAYFVQLEQMPVTTSGKINRKLLPDPGDNILGTGIEYEAPVNETEGKLVNIWQEILHIEDSDRIGVLDDFFELGGDSLAANQVIARIRERLYVDISLRNFFEQPSIRALAGEVARSEKKVSVIGKARREGKIPLSFAQERLWFLQELDNENIAYHVPRVIRFDGELKVSLLERTLSEIIRRHEILRTVFPTVDGQPVQRILDPFDFQAPIVDFSYLCPEEQSIRVSQWIQEEGQREFDLEKGPMMRITLLKLNEKQHILGLTEHHLVHDGWTQGVLLNEFVTIFSAYALDRPSPLPELPIQYADFAIWQRNFLQGEILENHLDYWQKKLAGLPPVLELPTDRPRPPVISGKGGMKELWLSERLSNELSQFSKERGVTLFMTMLAVFKVFLYRYTGSQDLCIGTGMANRRYKELEGMLGMVINTLALRTQFSGEMSFEELLNHVRTTCLEAYEYEDTPFGKVVEVIRPERSLSYNPIVQVLFSFMDIPAVDFVLPGLEIRGEFPHNRSSKFDLAIIVVPPQEFQGEEHRSETLMEWEYSTDIFDDETIDRMLTHYLRLLENTLIAPREKISYLHLLNNEEIHQLLYQWNDTTASYPHRQTIHELFAIQAERTPDQMALVGVTGEIRKRRSEEEKKEEYPFGQFVNAFDEGHLSYCELNKRSGKVAELLIEKGVQPDTIVGIMVERSLEMVVGLLGILKAGSTYMPIDPDYPGERIDYMLTDSGAKILVSDRNVERIGHCPVHVLSALYSSPFERSARSSVNLAYVIYTSGSTGKPKGVLVQHMSVVNLAYSQKQYFKIDKEDRILLFSSICFDASVEQIFIALLSGAVLVVIDKATLLHGDRFDRFICRHAVTHIHAVPSFLNTIGLKRWSHLKRMISGGDVCPAMLVKQWRPYCDFYNEYGPTETTVTSTEILVKDVNDHSGRLPIGKPINNTFIYLLNSGMNLVPLGVPGDLYIGGDGLARGYLNRPELSAEKFIFVSSVAKKIYQSGDLARWLRGGIIEFLGRQDQQVKIRGFRVELEEIEKQLLTHKIVKEAVVIVSTNEKTDKYICAYIVPDSIGDWNVSQLREHLSGKLPAYMIPTYFVSLERIPLNPNGKIDRQALPNPLEGGALKQSQVVYVAPRNELEEKIAHIWSDILNIEYNAVGIDSNFFELGGHSLNATLLTARIHKISNVRVPLKELFIRPSIRELVLYIEGSVEEKYRPIEICEEREYYELSSAQRRVYIEQQVEHDSTSYNMRFILQLAGHLDREKLQTTFRQLIKRHESFRTSFEMSDYRPVQRIYSPDDISFDIEYYRVDSREKDISAAVEQVITNFIRPFELSSPPLLRVGLVEKGPDTYVLMVEVSHIIGDGTSMEVLLADFASLYKGEQLPSLQLSYRDFSQWHNRLLSSGHMKKQEIYWLERFKDPALILNMPLDFPRPAVWSGEGGSLNFQLDREFITRIRDLSVETGTTLYVILLAVVNIILFIYTGQGDITVGSPMAGRVHANIERLIGIFVNMLAMRNHPTEEKTVEEFLEEVKKNTFDAFANQEYPFENLVRKLGRRPAAGRNNPLFDVVLAVQNMPVGDMKIENLQVTPYEDTRLTMNQYDLLIQAVEGKDTIDMRLEYSISLFKPPTAEQIVKHFIEVLKQVVDHQDMKLKDIAISQHLLAAQPGILHDDDSDFRL